MRKVASQAAAHATRIPKVRCSAASRLTCPLARPEPAALHLMADRVLEIDPLPDRHLGLVLERVPGQPPRDQHGGNRGEEPDNQRAGPQRPPASPSLLDLKKAEERKLAQALRGLALPSHQIDTAADRGERERRGHPQAEQPLEPRGRSAEVQRLLLPQPNWILPTLGMPTSLLRGQTSGVTAMVAWPRRSLTTLAGPSRFTPWDDALH
jgi:hypothetical protein